MNDLTPLQKAFLVIEKLESERDALERSRTEPIAIIGMGCCFPGGAENPESFWTLLQQGKDAISEIPPDRWNVDRFYDPDPNAVGKMYCRHIGFVDRLQDFDADFFGISPREARSLDPQHRLLLEVAWEALESASLTPDALSSLSTGVFVGICSNDYTYHLLNRGEERIDAYLTSGNAHSTAAGRLSYLLGLTGPCLAVDTACSSSLVAIHLACSSLRNRECDTAIASGVNRILSPVLNINFCKARMLAADGRCKTFDIKADGFVRSEGCGAIVLKRLSDARRDGDNILALIRGSAINQDGRTSSLTVPNGLSQQAVIRQALQAAEVHPSQVSYVEAHGTGTSLGDPIEVGALGAIFGADRSSENPLAIGSVKTNIGHLEAAAGIASLIKVVLQLQHQEIAPHLHLHQPNPYIDWESLPIKIPTQSLPWSRTKESRLAGVSSFSFSGTNAHLIVEEAPVSAISHSQIERPLHLLALSAKDRAGLTQLAQRYENYLKSHPDVKLADVCLSSNSGRVHFEQRLTIIGENRSGAIEQLEAWQQERVTSSASVVEDNIGILFTGQGSQYIGMGRELYETQPRFTKTINYCSQVLDSYLEQPLLDILFSKQKDNSLIDQTTYTQPALFALEYALYQLWISWGIQPHAVMGHSVGEYVAACVAGVFSLEDGLKLIAARGQLMGQLPPGGEMVSLMASVQRVTAAISNNREVVIAAINGPESTVISGAAAAVQGVVARLESEGIKSKPLKVSHGFHSPLMAPMLAEFEQVARQINYSPPQMEMISNITGKEATDEVATPEYWCRHVLSAVNFVGGMETLHQRGCQIFLECGAQPLLLGMGRQCLPEAVGVWLPSLRPGRSDWQQMLESLGELYVRGVKVDWQEFDRDYPQRRKIAGLPTYPFQRQRYWIDPVQQRPDDSYLQARTDIVKLLNDGNTKELTERIGQSDRFTDDQLQAINRALDILTQQHWQQLQGKNTVARDYYDAMAFLTSDFVRGESVQSYEDRFLTFGPFPEILPDFSWVEVVSNPRSRPEQVELLHQVQQEMRTILFARVNFSVCESVLDFGCGYASDIIALAEKYPHLRLSGYTISEQQARIGVEKVKARQLQERVRIFRKDSARDEYPDNYDLVFGFEVAHHIPNKKALFGNIGQHLNENGHLVLADFISNANFAIEHDESSSFFITKNEWVDRLSENRLQVVDCIDISREIANFLSDKNFQENLEAIDRSNRDETIKAAFQSYKQLGGLLQKSLTSYILLTAKKQSQFSEEKLRQWNRDRLDKLVPYSLRSPQQWLYELSWQLLPSVPESSTSESSMGQWLIFVDRQGLGEQLATRLERGGQSCTLVYRGETNEQISTKQWQIRVGDPANYLRVCQTLAGDRNWKGVVHLWSLDSEKPEDLSVSALQEAQQLGCASALHMVQALSQLKENQSTPNLWLITRGSQAVDKQPHSIQVQQSPLWGLGRVIILEHPEINCRLIDLDLHEGVIGSVRVLVEEMLRPDGENQLAYRQARRYGARLKRFWYPRGEDTLPVEETGSYLIVGGLGALGLQVSQWLVEKGARHLILASRQTPSREVQKVLEQIKHKGATIRIIQGNIAQTEDVKRIFTEIETSMPSLRGVIHAAGVLDDGVLVQQSWERFEKVMIPKVLGSWNLHQYTQHLPLDFFACFSSAASLLGFPGQGNYSAANAFMDGLAHYRRGKQLVGLSINWGPWADIGMAARLDSQKRRTITELGFGDIPVRQGLELLDCLFAQTRPAQLGVVPIDWNKLLSGSLTKGLQSFFSDIISKSTQSIPDKGLDKKNKLVAELRQASQNSQQELISIYLNKLVGEVLGFPPQHPIDPLLGFFDMGMDSLLALELRNRLQSDLDISLSSTLIFKFPTINDLAAHLRSKLNQVDISSEERTTVGNPQELDNEEVRTTLEQELSALQNILRSDS